MGKTDLVSLQGSSHRSFSFYSKLLWRVPGQLDLSFKKITHPGWRDEDILRKRP